jgi:glycosyltransferase involved in cell wall biosynthesis
MNIAILTNEYPPNIYGGAGVHVEYLSQELASLEEGRHRVSVLCFGEQREDRGSLQVRGVMPPIELPVGDPRHRRLLATLLQDLVMSGLLAECDIVHCHTWYSHFAGCLGKFLRRVPLVLTTHSLEPQRPWKAEQLGTAYRTVTMSRPAPSSRRPTPDRSAPSRPTRAFRRMPSWRAASGQG